MVPFRTIEWLGKAVRILDQTKLPETEIYIDICTLEEMCEAIKSLRIRGAPAIGIAAAFGLVLGALENQNLSLQKFKLKIGSLPITETISDRILTLPLYPNMTKEEKNYLLESIFNFFEMSIH